jgi:hypothetical protein
MQQGFVEEADLHAVLHEAREVLGILRRHVALRGFFADRLEAQRVEQQARGDVRVRGSFSISARADSTTPLRTSSMATPSYRSLSVALRMRSGSTSARPSHDALTSW